MICEDGFRHRDAKEYRGEQTYATDDAFVAIPQVVHAMCQLLGNGKDVVLVQTDEDLPEPRV